MQNDLLKTLGQEHLLPYVQKSKVLQKQISSFDPFSLHQQKEDFLKKYSPPLAFRPLEKVLPPQENEILLAESYLKEKSIACVLMAGGQAARLQNSRPKGCIPLSPVMNKSLFQIFSEKIYHAEKKYEKTLYLLIMLSPLNEKEVKKFFKENHFFGLKEKQVFFFCQNLLPFLDEKGKFFLQDNNHLAVGPDGNGELFFHMAQHNLFSLLQQKGIEYLSIFPIDNPLIDPLHLALLGRHLKQKNAITVGCMPRKEKTGLLVKTADGKITIVEYLYLRESTHPSTKGFSNINHFFIDRSFAETIGKERPSLFYHKTWKKIPFHTSTYAWKCEKFFFDNFIFSPQTGTLLLEEKSYYAPLKQEEDIDKLQKALFEKDKKILQLLTRKKVDFPIELSFAFHYPTEQLKNLCQKKAIPRKKYLQKSDLEESSFS